MKYPWVGLSILIIWLVGAIIGIARKDVRIEYLLTLILVSTLILGFVGFRSPK